MLERSLDPKRQVALQVLCRRQRQRLLLVYHIAQLNRPATRDFDVPTQAATALRHAPPALHRQSAHHSHPRIT